MQAVSFLQHTVLPSPRLCPLAGTIVSCMFFLLGLSPPSVFGAARWFFIRSVKPRITPRIFGLKKQSLLWIVHSTRRRPMEWSPDSSISLRRPFHCESRRPHSLPLPPSFPRASRQHLMSHQLIRFLFYRRPVPTHFPTPRTLFHPSHKGSPP